MASAENLHHLPERVARLRFLGQLAPARFSNHFWVRLGGTNPVTVADLTTWIDSAAMTTAITRLYARCITAVEIYKLQVVYMSSTGLIETEVDASIHGGHAFTAALPAQVAALVSWHTAEFYKGGHPRSYLPGLDESDLFSSTELQTSSVIAFSGNAAAFRAQVNATSVGASDWELGVARFSRAHAELNPAEFHPFTRDPTCQQRLCTQRRRLGRTFP